MTGISSIAAAASSASAVSQLMTDASFSTTVGGKTYSADVTYSNGQYVADDSNLPGAEATGSSLQAAENNLTARIDVLV
jgi:acetylornithine/succinyldiaminopimelate/putrescine aminotransferase